MRKAAGPCATTSRVRYKREHGPLLRGPLTVGFSVYGDAHHFGPELQFGWVMGDYLNNQVLLIKTAWGGKSLYKDFRPPGSGGQVGPYYTRMIAEVREALANLKTDFPSYDGGGYELAGFVWYHGWNDGCEPKTAVPQYETNLVNLVKDVRRELNTPDLPVVIGELTGPWVQAPGEWATLRKAQAAAAARPEFRGNVLFVETHDFVRKPEDSPNPGHGHHEFGNAETYILVGDALGKAMVKLLNASRPSDRMLGRAEGDLRGLAAVKPRATWEGDPTTVLWFDKPATSFQQSLPLGNGRIGAMVFGGPDDERIVLNESSVWSGSRQDADRSDAHRALPEIRRLLLEGRNVEAEKLVNANFTCRGPGSGHARGAKLPFGCYQTLGNLRLKFARSKGAIEDYQRELDLATAMARVTYRRGGVQFSREHFVSAPDEVLVSRLAADKAGAVSFVVTIDRPERFRTTAVGDSELLMTGTLDDGHGGKGVSYAARLRVAARGGSVKAEGNTLVVENADEVVLLLAAATDFKGFAGRQLDDALAAVKSDLDRAAAKSFDELRTAQKADHEKWFKRVELNLPATVNSALPNIERLIGFAQGAADPALAALYFNFGRYLLISSSRPGGLPANLQGIWAEEVQTPWNGDWHLDINVQMNYWPAEVCNLSELHEPLHKLVASLVEPGRRTAKAYYNSRGWVAHVVTNPWGFTSPGESASWGATQSGSAWLCQHLWEHYAFTLNREFLRWAYPILKESSLFYLDNLVEEPKHKWLVTGPSNSPENPFRLPDGKVAHVCLGPTIDMQLLRELFGNTARAAEILGVDPDFRRELAAKRARLAPNQIGPDGRLQEWLEPYPEPEPAHRHTSLLYGLHPYYEITRRGTPALAAACRKSLDARGDQSNGWALAWRINFWARLGDGDRAHKLLAALLHLTGEKTLNYTGRGAGSYANLFDACPPFQIDGNFGGCAGIAEMLLQSHAGEIELLPALPKAWPSGSVRGLCARGGFEVDIQWKDGALTEAVVKSRAGRAPSAGWSCRLRYGDQARDVRLPVGESFRWSSTAARIATRYCMSDNRPLEGTQGIESAVTHCKKTSGGIPCPV